MATPRNETLNIPVGSAYVYCTEFTGEIPQHTVIETTQNHLEDIEAGLPLTYSSESSTLTDDFGNVNRTVMTGEDVKAKLGLITWNYAALQKLTSTARVKEADGVRTVKIGGLNNCDDKQWLFRFYHPDKKSRRRSYYHCWNQHGWFRTSLYKRRSNQTRAGDYRLVV